MPWQPTRAERIIRPFWMWSQDGAPSWFVAYIGDYMWQPFCWARGYHVPHHCDFYFEMCVWCRKCLWSKRRNGSPNPLLGVDRSPIGWRQLARRAA